MEVISLKPRIAKNAVRVFLREILPAALFIAVVYFWYASNLNVPIRHVSKFYDTNLNLAFLLVMGNIILMCALLHLMQLLIYPPHFVATDGGLSKKLYGSTLEFDWKDIESLTPSDNLLSASMGITFASLSLESAKGLRGGEFVGMKVECLIKNLLIPTLWLGFPSLLMTSDFHDLFLWNKKFLNYHLKVSWREIDRSIEDFKKLLFAFKPKLELQKPSEYGIYVYFALANVIVGAFSVLCHVNKVSLPAPPAMLGLALFIAGGITLTLFAVSDIQNRVRLVKS
jgi:hypothetical protein